MKKFFCRFPGTRGIAALCAFFLHFGSAFCQPIEDDPAAGISLEIAGIGVLSVKQSSMDGEQISRLLLEKPGGMVSILASFDGLDISALHRIDLDGDDLFEILAIVKNKVSDDYRPVILREQDHFKMIYPKNKFDNSVTGKEITLVSNSEGPLIGVKVKVSIHDFGPPDLFRREFYAFRDSLLVKVREELTEGDHFNLRLNIAGIAFEQGNYKRALAGYQQVMAGASKEIPDEAKALILFQMARSAKYLKDYPSAVEYFQKLIVAYPDSELTDSAQRDCEFLAANIDCTGGLSFYVDVSRLMAEGRFDEVLRMLQTPIVSEAQGSLAEHFSFIQAEALLALGKLDEAIAEFRAILMKYPDTGFADDIEAHLRELGGEPESVEEP